MKISKKTTWLLLSFFTLSANLPAAHAQERDFFPEASNQSIYIFSEHLPEAQAEIFFANKENRKGIWEQEQFQFYGLQDDSQIRVVSGTEGKGDTPWQAMQMNSLPMSSRKLQYMNVPTGQTLNIYYKLELRKEDQEKFAKQNFFIYFSIYAGKKMLRKIRLSSQEKGWLQVTLPLDTLSLLNRSFPVTFGLTGTDDMPLNFQFFAEVLQ